MAKHNRPIIHESDVSWKYLLGLFLFFLMYLILLIPDIPSIIWASCTAYIPSNWGVAFPASLSFRKKMP